MKNLTKKPNFQSCSSRKALTHEHVFETIDKVGAARSYRSAAQRWAGLRIMYKTGNIKLSSFNDDRPRQEPTIEEEPNGFSRVKHLENDQRHLRFLLDELETREAPSKKTLVIKSVLQEALNFLDSRQRFWASQ